MENEQLPSSDAKKVRVAVCSTVLGWAKHLRIPVFSFSESICREHQSVCKDEEKHKGYIGFVFFSHFSIVYFNHQNDVEQIECTIVVGMRENKACFFIHINNELK